MPRFRMHAVNHWIGKHAFANGHRALLIDAGQVIAVAGPHPYGRSKHCLHCRLNTFRGWIGDAWKWVNFHHGVQAMRGDSPGLHLSALGNRIRKQLMSNATNFSFGDVSRKQVHRGVLRSRRYGGKTQRRGLPNHRLRTGVGLAGLGANFDAVNQCHGA